MEAKVLNKESRDEISFMSFIIPEFAAAYKMNVRDSILLKLMFGELKISDLNN